MLWSKAACALVCVCWVVKLITVSIISCCMFRVVKLITVSVLMYVVCSVMVGLSSALSCWVGARLLVC